MAKKYCLQCEKDVPLNVSLCQCGGTSFEYINAEDATSEYQEYGSTINQGRLYNDETAISREGGYRVSTVTFKSGNFPIVTSNYIPGKEIVEVVGLVFTSSNRKMGLSTTNLASNTFKDAYKDIELKAKGIGANAVISLSVAIERAGAGALNFSQTVTLVGTAVKIVNIKR
jgi:uncharacterized protein YbjQ (UPF0145 family)